MKIILLSCLWLISVCVPAFATEASWTDFQQAGSAAILNFPTQTPRSASSHSFTVTSDSFTAQKKGRGAFDHFELVDWLAEATGTIKDRRLIQKKSLCVIKDLEGNTLYQAQKDFDYEKKKITIKIDDRRNPKRARVKNYTFPIKGPTIDEICLTNFVKSFIPYLNEKNNQSFYLITFEPALYKVLVKQQGQETITLPSGRSYDCVKIRLIADMGILDNVFDQYVPATFVWYQRTYPFQWVQYQGLETGRHSTNILSYSND